MLQIWVGAGGCPDQRSLHRKGGHLSYTLEQLTERGQVRQKCVSSGKKVFDSRKTKHTEKYRKCASQAREVKFPKENGAVGKGL